MRINITDKIERQVLDLMEKHNLTAKAVVLGVEAAIRLGQEINPPNSIWIIDHISVATPVGEILIYVDPKLNTNEVHVVTDGSTVMRVAGLVNK